MRKKSLSLNNKSKVGRKILKKRMPYPADYRMLELIDILKSSGKIRFRQEFCEAIGMPKQNIRNITNGIQHFSTVHISKACREYKIDANWILDVKTKSATIKK